ncbi:hypothetical protein D1816_04485 [Aquimarina sp. AD10]|uniref:M1 family aminopeptidase n=1 Tax=Aquimarina sp. AD10 TaxID=1714849 RepID=UPI000E480D1F|nr:M1 family aminopeptidase [Aquimarina sp. AD10]AXT59643.1 hypothetical protein D1816_04485 [Aquimarina sp. AD10]RKM97519.1 hypothetical protein D7033_14065 [Aquimarina sp. AD10]
MWYEIFKFELKYRAKRPDTYIYFGIVFLYAIIAVDFLFEGNLDPIQRNAPIVIARTMGIISALFMMITSMIMGVAALRDFDHRIASLIFINPINKKDYLLGRFLGSFVILLFIFSGLLGGMILGDIMPWVDQNTILPFNFWHYFQPFICLVVPTLFFGGAIFFVTGALSRKLIVVYTQGIFFLMIYLLTINLAKDSDYNLFTAFIDPFTFQNISITTQFWSVAERNSLVIPFEGILMYNRLFWITIGIISLIIGYYKFKFTVISDKIKKQQALITLDVTKEIVDHYNNVRLPSLTMNSTEGIKFKTTQLLTQALFNFKSIIKGLPFWTIVLCALGIILLSSFDLGTSFGVDSYPTTYIVIGELIENTVLFFLLIIIFYSGELVWKDRDNNINGISDTLPISDFVNLSAKLIALLSATTILIFVIISSGIIFQTAKGYYNYQLDLYFIGFFVEVFPFLFLLSIICFLIQALLNHKFLAHIIVVIFIFVSTILLNILGYDHGLYSFGGSDLGAYSDMNGYGHFIEPFIWFKIYWISFSLVLFIFAALISIRGAETNIISRCKVVKIRLSKRLKILAIICVLVFGISGAYIFYNTNILNTYSTTATENIHRAEYEKNLKKYVYLKQPKIVDINLVIDLYPSKRSFEAKGYFILVNTHDHLINEIHVQKKPQEQINLTYVDFEGGYNLNTKYETYGYHIYELHKPLKPGDSIKMKFKQDYVNQGFTEKSNTDIVYNGTFFNNFYFPTIGYNDNIELDDDEEREKHNLKPKIRRAKINDSRALLQGRSGGDGEEINFEIIIGTESNQIGVAPGYLQKEWIDGNRKYYHYKMDKPMSNFYSILSAEYQVKKDQWNSLNTDAAVDLEIYYHKGHEYNLNRMMNGMKKSFDYFTKHFSPYQYKQMRIVESTSYKKRAQSFPNIVPFSESIGFIMDINDEEDVDMPFYITAHEMAHQWWGHQINPADVQGRGMLSETLAQYAAIMVLKQEYPEEKVRQFIETERKRYLKGRAAEKGQEMPLYLVESGQEYIHYGKGALNMYAFQDYITEDSVNIALKRFIRDWDSFEGIKKKNTKNYPTTLELLKYFKEVTPDSMQYVINDLFETVTLYNNRVKKANFKKVSDKKYAVNITIEAQKYKVDSLGIKVPIGINDWIDIGIYTEDSGYKEITYLQKHKITNRNTVLQILVDKKPVSAGIDPKHILIDKNVDDNVMHLTEK